MRQDTEQQMLEILRELRDGQREIIAHLAAQRTLAEEQMQKSRASIEESIGLQREGLRRHRSVMLIAVSGILACMAAIAYLVLRYF